MALLRQCLQEVRARQGDRDIRNQNGLSQGQWLGTSVSSANPSSPSQAKSFVKKFDAPCSSLFSNQRSTAQPERTAVALRG